MKTVVVSFCLLIIFTQVMAAEPRCIECIIAQKELQMEAEGVDKKLSGGDDFGDSFSKGRIATGGDGAISGEGSGDRFIAGTDSGDDKVKY